jgi:hypothetical protein
MQQPWWIEVRPGELSLRIRVRAKSRGTGVLGADDTHLTVRVTAAASGGQANRAVGELLARLASVPKSAVTLHRGKASRDKVFRIAVADAAATAVTLRTAVRGCASR